MQTITLREATPTRGCGISPATAHWLTAKKIATVQPSATAGYFDIFTGNVCGIVSSHGTQFEIAPKLPTHRLISLLTYSRTGLTWEASPTQQQVRDVVDLLMVYFASELSEALRFGLLRGYETTNKQSRFYRGRLRLKDQLSRHQMRIQPLEVQYQNFTSNIPENQILLAAVNTALDTLTKCSDTAVETAVRQLRRARATFRDVTTLGLHEQAPRWSPNALNKKFHHPLDIAELILSSRGIEAQTGKQRSQGVLIETWRVFETAVARAFRDSLPAGSVSTQQSRRLSPDTAATIRPDLVISDEYGPCAVADTKYKDGNSLHRDDLYQAVVYATVYGLSSSTLIYAGRGSDRDIRISGSDITIQIRFADTSLPLSEFQARVAEIAHHMFNR